MPPITCRIIPSEEVYFFQAESKSVFLATRSKRRLYDATLKDIEAQTDPTRFVRISKSAIVAVDKIDKLSRWFQGSYLAVMSDDNRTELKTGRTYLPALRKKLLF